MADERLSYTVDEGISAIGMGTFQYKLLAYAGVGVVGEAMELMLLSYVGLSAQHDLELSVTDQNVLSIVTYLATLLGAFVWGIVADRFGRKRSICGLSLFTSFFGIASAFSPNYMLLLILRAFVGLGIGGAQVYTSWYLEFIPRTHRGHSMIWFFALGALGTILEALLAWMLMEVVVPENSWRWLVGGTALPSFVALLFLYRVPESPRFLCSQGRLNEAATVLDNGARNNNKKLPKGRLVFARIEESSESDSPTEGTPAIEVMRNQNEVIEPVVAPQGLLVSSQINESVEAVRTKEIDPSSIIQIPDKDDSKVTQEQHYEVSGSEIQSEIRHVVTPEITPVVTPLESEIQSKPESTPVVTPRVIHEAAHNIENRSTLEVPLLGNKNNGDSKSKHSICTLVSGEWRRITVLLWLLYFSNSYSYSSLISLLSSSFTESPIWQYGTHKKPSYYKDTLITSVAEVPGLFLAYFTLDWIGRRYTMAIMSGGGIIVILAQIPDSHDIVRKSLVFCARMLTSASFVTLQIFAEEVYPTHLRTTGVGVAAVWGWIGGMVWPALGDKLGGGHKILPMCLYAFKFIMSAICALCLPTETLGRELEDKDDLI